VSEIVEWLSVNESVLWWVAASSVLVLLASVVIIPWLIVRIPADYFVGGEERRSSLAGYHPLLVSLLRMLRNVLASIFVAVGVVLLFLPGQGLLTLFLGVIIADFPGKHRAVNWLVTQHSVHGPINWLRKRAGKKPLIIPCIRRQT
jgi:hypothetical protein